MCVYDDCVVVSADGVAVATYDAAVEALPESGRTALTTVVLRRPPPKELTRGFARDACHRRRTRTWDRRVAAKMDALLENDAYKRRGQAV